MYLSYWHSQYDIQACSTQLLLPSLFLPNDFCCISFKSLLFFKLIYYLDVISSLVFLHAPSSLFLHLFCSFLCLPLCTIFTHLPLHLTATSCLCLPGKSYFNPLLSVLTTSLNHLGCHRYSHGVSSPSRHVRTRLYFTSESHIHSLLTVLRFGGLIDVCNFTPLCILSSDLLYH